METPGEGQVRAFVTVAGNPVLSTPNGRRLARAVEGLEAMVSVDYYINETTRFADVILPPAGPLADHHVDSFFQNFAAHDGIRWTEPAAARGPDERLDWEILLELAYRLGGGPTGIPAVDALMRVGRRLGRKDTPDETMELAVRVGPYGDKFLPWKSGLTGAAIRAAEHGVDLGPLKQGVERRVYHRDGLVDIAPPRLLAALPALEAAIDRPRDPGQLVLVGRRDIRSNNSWMANLPMLAKGRDRCVLLVHPDDAAKHGLADGGRAVLSNRVHSAEVTVRLTTEMRAGVVSLPHGYGHGAAAAWLSVAASQPGVSANDWSDDQHVETLTGQSILNGIVVELSPVDATRAARLPEATASAE
jgi:anaerobic selenocysteine-containing dehydrogenase